MTSNLKVMPLECGDEIWRQKTRIMGLPYGEEIMIVYRSNHVGTVDKCDRQTDRQTDGRTDGRTGRQVGRFTMTKTALCIAMRDKMNRN